MGIAMHRRFDVVVFGATGFTGRLVAEELARRPRGAIRWAIAGRDEARLREVKSSLVGIHPDNGAVGIVIADVTDEASLRAMAAATRVLVTTVGPYVRYGSPVVAACVAEGTHYLDLTGEPAFVRSSRAAFHESARAARIKIVHCCGFDSVPADLGVWYTVSRLPPAARKHVRGYVRTRARLSGGTWASFLEIAALREPVPGGAGPALHRAPTGGQALPFPAVDRVIVAESARCRPDVYGPDFEYQHFLVLRDRRRALSFAAALAATATVARVGAARRWLAGRVPPGTGPDELERSKSWFELTFVGRADGERVTTRVSGGDPGYTETSRMLAASAWLLATVPGSLPQTAGVVTPVVAFGGTLIDELQRLGLQFEVVRAGPSTAPAR